MYILDVLPSTQTDPPTEQGKATMLLITIMSLVVLGGIALLASRWKKK